MKQLFALFALSLLVFFGGCGRLHRQPTTHGQAAHRMQDLSFNVRNMRSETVFVTCFYWARLNKLSSWDWHKSDVYRIPPQGDATIHINTIADPDDRADVYGWLAVFDDYATAQVTAWTQVPDSRKIALNRLEKLKSYQNGTYTELEVVLIGKHYGLDHQRLDFRLVPRGEQISAQTHAQSPEDLHFWVENKTDELMYATCFVLGHYAGHDQWEFEESPIVELTPGAMQLIHVASTFPQQMPLGACGYLTVFRCAMGSNVVANLDLARTSFAGLLEKLRRESDMRARAQIETHQLSHADSTVYLNNLVAINDQVVVLTKESTGIYIDREGKPQNSSIQYHLRRFDEPDTTITHQEFEPRNE